MELSDFSHSFLSLLAPAVAILMAVMTRRVLLSLGAGIITGALLLTGFHPLEAVQLAAKGFLGVFWDDGINTGSLFILLFLLLLGIMTSLISLSGGAAAFGEWARHKVKSKQSTQLLTVLLGVIIFIDDYFNSLAVGNVCRPLTDRHKVSRAKLAYLIDSTAAPVCVVTPVSSWGAYVIALVGSIMVAHGVTDQSPIHAFLTMIPMNLYAVFALAMVIAVAGMNLNVGLMKVHEEKAADGYLYDIEKGNPPGAAKLVGLENGRISDLIMPIVVLVFVTLSALIWTGAENLADENLPFSVLGSFENTDVGLSLIWGAMVGLFVTAVHMVNRNISGSDWYRAIVEGVSSMLSAIYILVLAWVLIDIISELETGKYLAGLISDSIPASYLPMILFGVSGLMAFATGTSWGTFGIMLPIAGDMAAAADIAMLLPMLSAVLAGAVFGDHCSPISDTTILSSTGASCHHIDHVITQLPYALVVAFVSLCGYLVMGITNSVGAGFSVALLVFCVMLLVFKKLSGAKVPEMMEDRTLSES
ncbi:Malate-2H(+)/Na(+)-lactate antiporter [invertebrate metagenome]|uniref:Malate-2H(+)/Na(+)-lactate antiporter n=1 Tax=invertebrate metagenome TaxID=1711999 RepID=A0A2H9TBB5_9ZZZZ